MVLAALILDTQVSNHVTAHFNQGASKRVRLQLLASFLEGAWRDTHFTVQLLSEHGHLLDDDSRLKLRNLCDERGHRFRTFGVIGVEFLVADFAQDFICKLGVVVGLCQNMKELGHWLRQMLKVCEVLDDVDLRGYWMLVQLFPRVMLKAYHSRVRDA